MSTTTAEPTATSRVIVTGVDGSDASAAALLWAADQARRTSARLRVVVARADPAPERALAPQPVWPLPIVNRRDLTEVQRTHEFVEKFAHNTLVGNEDLSYDVAVRDGDPAETLITEAADSGASLIVVGRRGLGPFKRLLLGSVSDKVAAHAPCPVMVVTDPPGHHQGAIVVGVDGSAGSRLALQWAAEQADLHQVPLRILSAWDAPIVPADSLEGTLTVLDEGLDFYSTEAKKVVEGSLASCRQTHPDVAVSAAAVRGEASVTLLQEAAKGPADMLVVGTRGRGGFATLLLGSVAHQCLHHATVPVTVVRSVAEPAAT